MARRVGWWALGVVLALACGTPSTPDGGSGEDGGGPDSGRDAGRDAAIDAGGCRNDDACDDGLFCNGAERCAPEDPGADDDGCVAAVSPCLSGQSCDEAADACVTECGTTEDADGDGVTSIDCGGTDCDDSDRDRYPGNLERCDVSGHDEDCNPATFGDRDLDGDLAIDAVCCNGTTCGTDCNDLVRGVNPSTSEVCDGYDNDCDGAVDEDVRVEVWPDADFDLHGDASPSATSSMQCPGTPGWSAVQDDCDDTNPAVHAAQVEICDDLDNDCDTRVDEAPAAVTWYLDADDDGFGDPTMRRVSCEPQPGYSLRGTDCDDSDPDTNPSVRERCDGRDNNCNGLAEYVLGVNDFEDDDGDGRGDLGCVAVGGAGTDCDDRDPSTFPGATEICDRRDNDCNGMIDDGTAMGAWYPDADRDTYGEEGASPVMSCDPIAGHITRAGDCDDLDALIHPNTLEPCDGEDNDCDGDVDESAPERAVFYRDGDGDGLGREDMTQIACSAPSGYAPIAGDCDDASASVGERLWFADGDTDTYGAGGPVLACTAPAGHVASSTDCDDGDGAVHPGATEVCNGVDDDCSGMIDGDDADTSSDPLNCGACGRACASGELCNEGRCESIIDIDGGAAHFCALVGDAATVATTGGRVECWGSNASGRLGDGTTTNRSTPVPVQRFAGVRLEDAIDMCAGTAYSCAVRAGGTVVCWGDNTEGQLGIGSAGGSAVRASSAAVGVSGAVRIGCGAVHACAVTSAGEVWCWGRNGGGQLGIGATSANEPTPVQMLEAAGTPLTDAIDVAGDVDNTCIARSGATRVSCVGWREFNGLGDGGGTGGSSLYPVAVAGLPAGAVEEIDAGTNHTCVRITGQLVHCWGHGAYGQLDRGSSPLVGATSPVDPVLEAPTSLALGQNHTCIVYTHPEFGNRVACFGADGQGQLGDGTASPTTPDPFPDDVLASPTTALTGVRLVGAGDLATCAILNSGAAVCWGGNGAGQLGIGSTSPSTSAHADTPVVGLP